MRPTTFSPRALTMGIALALTLLSPLAGSAQSQLDVAQAQAFMGSWVINMDTDFGPFSMNLELADQAGKVAASVGAPEMGGMQSVSNVVLSGQVLLLAWEVDAQGQLMDVMMTLTPDGQSLATTFATAGGEFSASGTATKAGG